MSTLLLFLFVTYLLVSVFGSGEGLTPADILVTLLFLGGSYGISAYQLGRHEHVAELLVSAAAEYRNDFAGKIASVSQANPEDAQARVSNSLVDVTDASKATARVLEGYDTKVPTTVAEKEARVAELTAQAVEIQRKYRAGYKQVQAQYKAEVDDSISSFLFVKAAVFPAGIPDWPDGAESPLTANDSKIKARELKGRSAPTAGHSP